MTSLEVTQDSAALRLARYLKEFVGLRSTIVRDVDQYESVLWFSEMPQERECWSAAWSDEYDTEGPWLEVKKQRFENAPRPPEEIVPWVDEKALRRATEAIPPLRTVILVADHEAAHEEGEAPPVVEHSLADHPEVREVYERYRPTWEAWSSEHRRRQAIQNVYADLFRLHTQVLKQGEIVEVVLGLGLLDWRPRLSEKTISIRRHVVVSRVEVTFDPANGVIRVSAPSDGAGLRLEDDMLEAELRPDRSHYAAVEIQLDEIGDAIWDKAQTHKALKSWAGALSADSAWSEGLGAPKSGGDAPAIGFAPALILRKRAQTGMVRIYNELIRQLSDPSRELPDGWRGLTDDLDEDSPTKTGATDRELPDTARPLENSQVFFPLVANREQRRIVEAIDRQRGVLVQGPPGTGKSHTIANLVCHLLATGKRVLITAETSRALQVLKEKLPEEIQPLCVSLLGQGGDAFAELNSAVQGITTRQAAYSPGLYNDRIEEIDADLDRARRRLAKIDSEIRSLREQETHSHVMGAISYSGTASAIAEGVARNSEQYNWLRVSRDASAEPLLRTEDLVSWLAICRRYTDDQISASKLRTPPSAALPIPAEFAAAIAAEAKASSLLGEIAEARLHAAYISMKALSAEAREGLRSELQEIEEQRIGLGRVEESWVQTAIRESITGRRARWTTLLELTREQLKRIEPLLSRLAGRVVTVPDGLDLRKVRADAGVALSHLNQGGRWKHLGLMTPKPLRGRGYLRDEVLVNGERADSADALQAVCDYLDLAILFTQLTEVWSDVGVALGGGDWRIRAAVLNEHVSVLDRCLKYAECCQRIAQYMAGATPPIPEPRWADGESQRWLELVKATFVEDRFDEAARTVDSCSQSLVGLRGLHDVHPLVSVLVSAVDARDVRAYSEAHAGVVLVETTRADQQARARVEAILEEIAPGLPDVVGMSLFDEVWDKRLGAWAEAWHWAIADAWLEKRLDFEYQRKLWEQRQDSERELGALVAEVAALRAWVHFLDRLSPRESAALKGWREAVRAIGKGTGRSAKVARLRREARQYMNACRDAIPVWIMPRYLVAEMVDPSPGRYDLVIADEASQLGVDSLFLFYIAKKLVVVGDDQQISPYGVGISDDAIAGLQHHYLEGVPHQHALSAQSSLYANAKIRFSQNIVLREHFRCMPEIIQFSNDLCYASNGTPLDPLRAYPANRLQPLVVRHVADGYRVGSAQNAQNPPEAEAIVAQIAACIADPRYAGATMGVVSLQGEAQAKLIERKLLEELEPEVIEERRLICGDAYAFQGDERTVMFLSMVAAPGEMRIGALTTESARQRFNVAVSRAQDQLWLFHTAELDVLSYQCMRHRLLSYMLDPSRQTTEESEQRFDSEFERLVFRRLTERGFHVRTQVCVGDPANHRYRIDLVVEGMQGRLAVECDGDEWHGPDRYEQDASRQRDLERAGWQFVRIRGGDFYRDPERAMEPVWSELDRLGIQVGGIDRSTAAPPEPARLEVPDRMEEEVAELELTEAPLPTESQTADASANVPASESRQRQTLPSGLPIDRTEGGNPTRSAGPGQQSESTVALPVTARLRRQAPYVRFEGEPGPDPRHANPAQVAEGLCRIIEAEGPMLAKRAYDVYLRACGIHRMGHELRRSMNRALQYAIRNERVVGEDESGKGGLIYSIVRAKGAPPVVVRHRGPRDFEEIPPSELQLAARQLINTGGFDSGSDAHLRAVLDLFDLKRLTVQVGSTLLDALGRSYPYVDEPDATRKS